MVGQADRARIARRKRLRGGGAEVDARFRWPMGTLAQSALAPSGTGLSALVLKAAVARETGSINPAQNIASSATNPSSVAAISRRADSFSGTSVRLDTPIASRGGSPAITRHIDLGAALAQ